MKTFINGWKRPVIVWANVLVAGYSHFISFTKDLNGYVFDEKFAFCVEDGLLRS